MKNSKFNNRRAGQNTAYRDIGKLYDIYLKYERSRLENLNRANAYLKAVIVFPNYYGVAMSNLGFLRAYELINLSGFMSCDRAFMQEDLSKGVMSLETRRRLKDYDFIFFSLSYENDFPNILSILSAEKLPFLSKDRNGSFPLIMAGGVIAFLNPEPVAPLFDLMFIGEAEAIFPDFFEKIKSQNKPDKNKIINSSAEIKGIYVPSAYDFIFDSKNPYILKTIKNANRFPQRAARRWADESLSFSSSVITTEFSELSNINMIEIERGCKRGCRFCSAGFIYLPLRESKIDAVNDAVSATCENEKAGFVGFGTMDGKNIDKIMRFSLDSGKNFSLSSVRFDCLDENNLDMIKESGIKTVTLGIETGSERLKKILNKVLSNENIIKSVGDIVRRGITGIKLYFMFGLPYEEIGDLDDTVMLVKEILKEFISASKANKRIGKLTASFSPFVPKAWTPLQWENFEDLKILKKKAAYIANGLRGIPNLDVNINSLNAALTEAFFARGSRLSTDILIYSFLNKTSIKKAAEDKGLRMDGFIRKIGTDELLPWDIIDQGVTKKYLLEEYKRALNLKTTPQCFEGCKRCGVCA